MSPRFCTPMKDCFQCRHLDTKTPSRLDRQPPAEWWCRQRQEWGERYGWELCKRFEPKGGNP